MNHMKCIADIQEKGTFFPLLASHLLFRGFLSFLKPNSELTVRASSLQEKGENPLDGTQAFGGVHAKLLSFRASSFYLSKPNKNA